MSGIVGLIEAAWERVGPRLRADAAELGRRLARRRSGIFRRAPRAWCLVVRATDQRLDPRMFSCVAEWEAEGKRHRRGHVVCLDAKELRRLCRPVKIGWGTPVKDAAALLGVGQIQIRRMVKRGLLREERGRGVRGRPIAMVYGEKLLDPAHPDREMEDTGWGTKWRWVAEHVPEDLRVELTRRPTELGRRGNRCGQWRWECPECGREVVTIYCPIPGPRLAGFVRWQATGGEDDVVYPAMKFACWWCHGVHDFGRSCASGWNDLVAFLTGGLLYGKEVERPGWWVKSRKRRWIRKEGRRRSKWQGLVEELLIETNLTRREIAAKLGCTESIVANFSGAVFRDWGVHTREALKEKAKRMPIQQQVVVKCGGRVA